LTQTEKSRSRLRLFRNAACTPAILDDGQRLLAETEARRYESLSDKERDSIWNEEADSIEAEAESDEIDLRPHKRRC